MSRRLTQTVLHQGVVYAVGTAESDIDDASKIVADVWDGSGDDSSDEGYSALKVDELKDEIRSRNEGRDEDDTLPLTGTKAELVAALEADDAASGS